MDIVAAEISRVIRGQIANFDADAQVSEVGTMRSIGDSIVRIHGLDNIQADEMIDCQGGRGMALGLESDSVGAVIFGSDIAIKNGARVNRTATIVHIPVGKGRHSRVEVNDALATFGTQFVKA